MNKEDNKTFENITNHIMQAAAKFNDKELTDAAKKFTDLVKDRMERDSKARNQSRRIKSVALSKVFDAVKDFVSNDKKDERTVLSVLIDGREDFAMIRGDLSRLASTLAAAMKNCKQIKAIVYQAVVEYNIKNQSRKQ